MKPWSLIAFFHFAVFSLNAIGATFAVTNIDDSGPGSLRQAVADANATPGLDLIHFDIAPAGPQTLTLLGAGLSVTAPLTIDGSTQPGFNGKPLITLTGAEGAAPGLTITTSNCLIRGLVISNFAGSGIAFTSNARNNLIGGTNSDAGNVIVGNASSGVSVISGTNNAIRGNSILGNGGLGIDLGDDGMTLNDNRDPDSGPNQLQNLPVLTSATISSNSVAISGSLNSRINTAFQIDFFANPACDESGSGEGQGYLGTRSVTTSGSGIANFSFTLPVAAPGRFITATATDPVGNTSEFAPCLRATSTIPPLSLTVVNTNDGGPGSLRQVILDLSERVTFGTNIVHFAIPGTNAHTIAPGSPLPSFYDPVILDGYTQPGASPNSLSNGFNGQLRIQMTGVNAGPGAIGVALHGDGSVVRGLALINFQGGGIRATAIRSNVIQGNLIGVDLSGSPSGNGISEDGYLYSGVLLVDSVGSSVGGAGAAGRNIISANGADGIQIAGVASRGNQVLGNFIGTDATGMIGFGNANWGINLDGAAANNVSGNLISWNGSGLQIFFSVSNRVQGNFIGCDVTGTNALGNGSGVVLVDASFNQIGGTNAAARNVVVANGQGGLSLSGASFSNMVQGNFIGTDLAGQRDLANGAFGIHLDTGDGNQIGGADPAAGNLIAFNGGNGVEIGDGLRNLILRNSIFSNGGLGIDLGNDGVTPNDADDTDTGANGLQNSPELGSAVIYTNRTVIRGLLRSRPGTYVIQLFENAECDDTGSGEGQMLLTNLTGIVPAGGVVNFGYTNASLFQAGHFITATATDVSNNTSEFSPCMKLASFNSVDVAVTQLDSLDPVRLSSNVTYTITVTNRGPTNATTVVLTDSLPPALTFVSVTTSQGTCSHMTGVVTCQLNTLNQGGSATVAVRARATTPGLVENIVSVTTSQVDNTPENNTAAESTLLGVADLAVSIVDAPDPAMTGQLLTYLVTVTNSGPNPATGVMLGWLTSPVAPAFEVLSATASQGIVTVLDGTAAFGTIPVHGSAVLTLKIVPLVAEPFSLYGAVTSAEADLDASNNEATEFTNVDPGSGLVQFAAADFSISEGGGVINVTLVRAGGDLGTVGVSYATSNATASAGNDFISTTGTVTFGPGETSFSLAVPIVDDPLSECNEHFSLTLFDPTGFPALAGAKRALVTIFDNDLVPQGNVAGVSVQEADSAATGGGASETVSLSADGRWVAFGSTAGDLTSADGNGLPDVFVRNLISGSNRLVSVNRFNDGSGNAPSDQPSLAAHGRSLAFVSLASDLVTNNVSTMGDVYVRNLMTETTTLVSVSTNTAQGGNAPSQSPAISSNGLVVAFTSSSVDLVTLPNPSAILSVFVRDLATASTRLVSVNRFGTGTGNGSSSAPRISADGRWVAFESEASDLVVADTNEVSDVFVRDLSNGTTLLLNIKNSGAGSGNGASCCASLSGNGRFIAFYSEATDLIPGGIETAGNIFVRDLVMSTTRLVSRNTNGVGANSPCRSAMISAEGRFVAFESGASDLVGADANGQSDIFVRDLLLQTMALASVACDAVAPGNAASVSPVLSGNGQSVAFLSLANNLAPGTFSGDRWQVFRRDLSAGTTALLSMNVLGTGAGDGDASAIQLSANGFAAAFASTAADLGPVDQNNASDIFAWTMPEPCPSADLTIGQTYLPNPASAAGQVNLTLTISNRGPMQATGLIVSNGLPAELAFVSANSSAGACSWNGEAVTCALGALDPQGSATIQVVVQPVGPGMFPSMAGVSSAGCDPVPGDNTASVLVEVIPVTEPLLSIQSAGVHFILEWPPETPSGFVLETTTNLMPSAIWSVISNASNPFVITNSPAEHARFYRLRLP